MMMTDTRFSPSKYIRPNKLPWNSSKHRCVRLSRCHIRSPCTTPRARWSHIRYGSRGKEHEGIEHKDIKAQRKAAWKTLAKIRDSLCGLPLCLCVFVFNALRTGQPGYLYARSGPHQGG